MGDALLSSVGTAEPAHTSLAQAQIANKRMRLMERMVKETGSRPTV
jgi:hypothetical protein